MKLKLITPEKLVLEKDVVSVTLPGVVGQFTVLDGHDFFAASLKAGLMYFHSAAADEKQKRTDFTIGGGMAEVTHNTVKVFASSIVL